MFRKSWNIWGKKRNKSDCWTSSILGPDPACLPCCGSLCPATQPADLRHLCWHHDRPGQLHHQRHHRGPDRAVLQGAVPHPGKPSRGLDRAAVQHLDGDPAASHHRRPGQRQPQPTAGVRLHRDVPMNIFWWKVPVNLFRDVHTNSHFTRAVHCKSINIIDQIENV